MTSGGITKQRVLTWAAIAFCVLALLCAIESTNSSDPVVMKVIAGFSLIMGIISVAGVWAAGLPKAEDPSNY